MAMNDLAEAMGGSSGTAEPADTPAKKRGRPPGTTKPDVAAPEVVSGDKCPHCEAGRCAVVRNERNVAKNYRLRVWGCTNRECAAVFRSEATPITHDRPMGDVVIPKKNDTWT